MGGNSISEIGKRRDVKNLALAEAQTWADELHRSEFRGLGDTVEASRYRLSRRIGVPESYLKRLKYRADEMQDVAGSVYRSLKLAYDDLCERNERAADAYRAERLRIEEHHAVAEKHDPAVARMAAAAGGEEEEVSGL